MSQRGATRCNTAILISGSGTNLQAFIDAVENRSLDLNLAVVFSNNADAYGLRRAEKAAIPTACIQHSDFPHRESFDQAVIAELDRFDPDLLILAGFMRILSPAFVQHYAGKILNIHPALLPRFPGLNTHQRVLDAGDQWHGSTVHFVTEKLDSGPGILQGRVAVVPGEAATDLAARVQAVEHRIYPQAAGWVGSGKVVFRNGQSWIDGQLAEKPALQDFQ